MQAIGWRWRDQIIWDKGSLGRKESTSNRCRRNYEIVLMFTKHASEYWYDQDPLRIPLVSKRAHEVTRHSTHSPGRGHGKSRKDGLANQYRVPGRHKDGLRRRDGDHIAHRVFSNVLGRVCDAIWLIEPEGWRGTHSAAMPERLVQNCLLLSCPPGGTALDPFGGSGTVSKVAKQLGWRSIYIDRHEPYVQEAKQRLAAAAMTILVPPTTISAQFEQRPTDRLFDNLIGYRRCEFVTAASPSREHSAPAHSDQSSRAC